MIIEEKYEEYAFGQITESSFVIDSVKKNYNLDKMDLRFLEYAQEKFNYAIEEIQNKDIDDIIDEISEGIAFLNLFCRQTTADEDVKHIVKAAIKYAKMGINDIEMIIKHQIEISVMRAE